MEEDKLEPNKIPKSGDGRVTVIPIGESHPEHGYIIAVIKEMMKQLKGAGIEYKVGMEVPPHFKTLDTIKSDLIYSGFENEVFDQAEIKENMHHIDLANQIYGIFLEIEKIKTHNSTLGEEEMKFIEDNNEAYHYTSSLSDDSYEHLLTLRSFFKNKGTLEAPLYINTVGNEGFNSRNIEMSMMIIKIINKYKPEVVIVNCGLEHLIDIHKNRNIEDVTHILGKKFNVMKTILPLRFDDKNKLTDVKTISRSENIFVEQELLHGSSIILDHVSNEGAFKDYKIFFGNEEGEIKQKVNEYLISIGLKVDPLVVEKEEGLGLTGKKKENDKIEYKEPEFFPGSGKQMNKPKNWEMKGGNGSEIEGVPSKELTLAEKFRIKQQKEKGKEDGFKKQ
jgi:hypothetical protein